MRMILDRTHNYKKNRIKKYRIEVWCGPRFESLSQVYYSQVSAINNYNLDHWVKLGNLSGFPYSFRLVEICPYRATNTHHPIREVGLIEKRQEWVCYCV